MVLELWQFKDATLLLFSVVVESRESREREIRVNISLRLLSYYSALAEFAEKWHRVCFAYNFVSFKWNDLKILQMLDKALNFVFADYEVDRMFRRATVRDSTCKI